MECYREHLEHVPGIQLNVQQKDIKSNYAYFPIIVDEKVYGYTRDDICEALKQKNIYARKYFYPITNAFDCYRGRFDVTRTPVAQKLSKQVLTLPLYGDLNDQIVSSIADIIYSMAKDKN